MEQVHYLPEKLVQGPHREDNLTLGRAPGSRKLASRKSTTSLFVFSFLTCLSVLALLRSYNAPSVPSPISQYREDAGVFRSLWGSAEEGESSTFDLVEFDSFVGSMLEEWGIPGCSVAIIYPGDVTTRGLGWKDIGSGGGGGSGAGSRTVLAKGFGTSGKDWRGRDKKVDENTRFMLASNSKAFTALSVSLLIERGLFNWTSNVFDLLHDEGLGLSDKEIEEKLTVIDMISHRSGYPRHDYSYAPGDSVEQHIARLKYLRPSAELREVYQYNNMMFVLASHLVKHMSNVESFVADNIFAPLHMNSSTYSPSDAAGSGNLSSTYQVLSNGSSYEIPLFSNRFGSDPSNIAGGGGIFSTVNDMTKWVGRLIDSNLRRGGLDEVKEGEAHPDADGQGGEFERAIPHLVESRTLMEPIPEYPIEQSTSSYGTGFMMSYYQGKQFVRHGGSLPGFGSQVVWAPNEGVGAVVLANADGPGNALADIVTYRALDVVLGLKRVDWNSRYRQRISSKSEDRVKRKEEQELASVPLTSSSRLSADIPLSAYEGTYKDLGYADVTICRLSAAIKPISDRNTILSPARRLLRSPVAENRDWRNLCRDVQDLVATSTYVDIPDGVKPTNETLVVWIPRAFIDHILLRRTGDGIWKGTTFVSNDMSEKDPTLVFNADRDEIEVGFDVEDGKVVGMGWKGVWGPGKLQREVPGFEVDFKKAV